MSTRWAPFFSNISREIWKLVKTFEPERDLRNTVIVVVVYIIYVEMQ